MKRRNAALNSTTPISWICKNQLGRRNLTPQQKKYLIGQRYDAEKKTHGGDRKSNLPESSGHFDHLIAAQKTRERIASETGTSESYVTHVCREPHITRGELCSLFTCGSQNKQGKRIVTRTLSQSLCKIRFYNRTMLISIDETCSRSEESGLSYPIP